MGAVNSCCIPRKSCDCGIGNRTSTPRGKGHRRNLSDTFNLSVIEEANQKLSGVDINRASEEELMTLHGINRIIAKNIIEYRSQIGGFRCIEDLALASGVGAEKFSHIRQDIYLKNLPNGTPNGSFSTVSTQTRDVNDSDLVNINSAGISELVKVKRIGNVLAENILDYRVKNGPFKSIEELSNVSGIGSVTLEQIRPFITVEVNSFPQKLISPSPIHANGKIGGNAFPNKAYDLHPIRKSSTEPCLAALSPSATPERADAGTVSLRHNNQPVLRIASWNLEEFSLSKARHPGVKDVVCMTILENSLGIIAFQELTNKKALLEICDELNHPSLPNVKKWKGRRGQWECVISKEIGRSFQGMEFSGFLYDKSQRIELISCSILERADDSTSKFTRKPFLAAFKVKDTFDCILVSVHLKATGLRQEDLTRTKAETDNISDIIKAVQRQVKGENDIIILGDFNLNADAAAFQPLCEEGYRNAIPSSLMTNIGKNNPDGTKSYDNIWISRQTQRVLAGDGEVIRNGLWSPWIPYDWGWGGFISNHCPVFAQLYTSQDLDNGDIHQTRTAHFTVGSKAG